MAQGAAQMSLPGGEGARALSSSAMLLRCVLPPLSAAVTVCEAASQHLVRLSGVQ